MVLVYARCGGPPGETLPVMQRANGCFGSEVVYLLIWGEYSNSMSYFSTGFFVFEWDKNLNAR